MSRARARARPRTKPPRAKPRRRRPRVVPACQGDAFVREVREALNAIRLELRDGIARAEAAMLKLVGQQCDVHSSELAAHGDRLDDHERRLTALETGRAAHALDCPGVDAHRAEGG